MKILILAGQTQSLSGFRAPFLLELVRLGHEVHATGPERDTQVEQWLAENKIAYHHLPLSRAGITPLADVRYARSVRKLVQQLSVQGVFAYTHKPIVLGLPAAKSAGAKVRVAFVTGLGYAFTSGGGLRRLIARWGVHFYYRKALRTLTHLFFQNPDDLGVFREMGLLKKAPQPQLVSGSGVPLEKYPLVPMPKTEPVFLMLSRLLADKGVREYAAAASILRQRYPSARCLLAGAYDVNPSAIKPEEMRKWVDSKAVEYLGSLEDVRTVLCTCTVYVLPSYREGTPRSVLEALATGRPIITTDAPGCRETMVELGPMRSNGIRVAINGLTVPIKDSLALAAAMAELASPAANLADMATASRRLAETKFDARLVSADLAKPFSC